jgi:hypothetical protein
MQQHQQRNEHNQHQRNKNTYGINNVVEEMRMQTTMNNNQHNKQE